ncbi:hypothetical protein OG259_09585 [Streptomyces sp. NBC_00250]|uniref:hypothetical protein n=1 Tax=Streptomyces sp. NBC_00250 TaxID=2903641 RepID=UPI002E2A46E1|nr:hypothetical protein [Streptomyces sp. NBC_00250]
MDLVERDVGLGEGLEHVRVYAGRETFVGKDRVRRLGHGGNPLGSKEVIPGWYQPRVM